MARRKGPKIIEDSGFMGLGAAVELNILKKLEVESFHGCANSVLNEWNDHKPIALPNINLSEENSEVINANIGLEGFIFSPEAKSINAKKIWGGNRAITLRLGRLDLASFIFRGRLYSEYLDGDQINYTLVENEEVIND